MLIKRSRHGSTSAVPMVVFLLSSLVGCDSTEGGDAGVSAMPRTRVFATIVSHNEQDNNPGCGPVLADEASFLENHANTLAFARAIAEAGGAYDLQTDYRWIEQMQLWETDIHRTETAGQNLLAYLSAAFPGQVAVDAHNHESERGGPMRRGISYADVAYLLNQLGVPDTGVVGGLLWYPYEDQDWLRFRTPVSGRSYEYTWQARVLWGAATRNHAGPDSEASGVWRPRSAEGYHEDDPTQTLMAFGSFDSKFEETGGAGIAELVRQVRAGEHPEGVMLTVSVFFDQCVLDSEDIAAVRTFIEGHQDDVAAGDLVWAPVPEVIARWQSEYDSRAYITNQPDLEASADCGGCEEGEICCPGTLPCMGRCVPDCRLEGGSCPPGASCGDDGLCSG